MRRKTLTRAAGGLLAAALTLSAAAPAVADDLPITTHWSVVVRTFTKASSYYTEISAAGPRAAWGLGTTGTSSYVTAWNGKRWRRMPAPTHLYGASISGLSASDVWLAGWLPGHPNNIGEVFRWNGRSWIRMLRGVDLGSVVAIRPADVFVQLGSGRLLRWNGRTWTAYPNPYGRGQIAAVGTQLWRIESATVGGRRERLVIQRWTGSTWRTMTSPHPLVAGHVGATFSGLSPHNVWVELRNNRYQTAKLLHWNGRVWSTLKAPAGWLVELPGVAAVGTDGVWIDGGSALWSGRKWQGSSSSCGSVTGVPGTSAALCAGAIQPGVGRRSYGVISQNGRLP